MKYIISIMSFFLMFFSFFGDTYSARNWLFNDITNEIPYCNDAWECGVIEWVDAIKNINAIETDRPASQYIQDVVKYILYFFALVATLIIIYSWFNMLISVWDEEKVKKSKSIILYAIFGLILIFLAWPLIDFVIWILDAQ
jgi:hypothetical protein